MYVSTGASGAFRRFLAGPGGTQTQHVVSDAEFVTDLNRRAPLSWVPVWAISATAAALLVIAFFLRFSGANSGARVAVPAPQRASKTVDIIELPELRSKNGGEQMARYAELKNSLQNDPRLAFVAPGLLRRDFVAGHSGWRLLLPTDRGHGRSVPVASLPAIVVVDAGGKAIVAYGHAATSIPKLKLVIAEVERRAVPAGLGQHLATGRSRRARRWNTGLFLLGIGGALLAWWSGVRRARAKRIEVIYRLDGFSEGQFANLSGAFESLGRAAQLWRVQGRQATRDPALCRAAKIRGLSVNVPVWGMDLGRLQLYALPDLLLSRENGRWSAVPYSEVTVGCSSTRFAEKQRLPNDAQLVGQTWKYVMTNGRPDRSRKRNKRIPIAMYGHVIVKTTAGLHVELYISSMRIASDFGARFAGFQNPHLPHSEKADSRQKRVLRLTADIAVAAAQLGVTWNASLQEVSAAYREMARQYHPDKITDAAPEFSQMAERKMKAINQAYEVLKRAAR